MLGSRTLFAAFAAVSLSTHAALAQTLPSGVINAPPTVVGNFESIGSGTTLNLYDGGVIGDAFSAGLLNTTNSDVVVNIFGGTVRNSFRAMSGSVVNVSGGRVGSRFYETQFVSPSLDAKAGSEVYISGGVVGDYVYARSDSTVNISGGTVGYLEAHEGSSVTVSGGTLGPGLQVQTGSSVELVGGDYRLNGVPFTEQTLTLIDDDIFTGVLTDGSPFVFSRLMFDQIEGTALTWAPVPPSDPQTMLVNALAPDAPSGLRRGQSLILGDGGVLGRNFSVVDANLHISGGSVGELLEVVASEVHLSDGFIDRNFEALAGSRVTISGGTVGDYLRAHPGSEYDIRGGDIGEFFWAYAGSRVTVSGGRIGRFFGAREGSTVSVSGGILDSLSAGADSTINISGGVVLEDLIALEGSTVNVIGSEFALGENAVDLIPGVPTEVDQRNEALTGYLMDGSAFEFDIPNATDPGLFDHDATLTLTLVPDPGDYNGDGQVDAADYGVFQSRYGEEVVPYSYADGNGDGRVDSADYSVWRDNVAPAIAASVPEPAGACLVVLAIGWATSRKRERPE